MTQLDLEVFDDMVIGNFFSDAWKATKSVIKSNITKAVVGGVAIVFPPVGVPAAAALVAADQVVRASESKDPKVRAKAKAAIAATGKLAKQGNTHAQAALKAMIVARAARHRAKVEARSGGSAATAAARMVPKPMTAAQRKAMAAGAGRAMAASMAARSLPGWQRSGEGQYKRAS